jgi:hypothetical protein
MNRIERRAREPYSGRGFLTRDGQRVCDVLYVVTEIQEFTVLPRGERLEGIPDLQIVLSEYAASPAALAGRLTLHLEDGRTFNGFMNGSRFIIGS